MTAIEWYYARGNKQTGPVTAVELKRLATVGELHPDDLVWREGLTEWAPARTVRGLFKDEAKPGTAEEISSQPVVPLAKSHGIWASPMYWATRPGGANSLAYSRNRADQSASPIENTTK